MADLQGGHWAQNVTYQKGIGHTWLTRTLGIKGDLPGRHRVQLTYQEDTGHSWLTRRALDTECDLPGGH